MTDLGRGRDDRRVSEPRLAGTDHSEPWGQSPCFFQGESRGRRIMGTEILILRTTGMRVDPFKIYVPLKPQDLRPLETIHRITGKESRGRSS